eukprot:3223335-Pleurochrysis_carterae.AAC.1
MCIRDRAWNARALVLERVEDGGGGAVGGVVCHQTLALLLELLREGPGRAWVGTWRVWWVRGVGWR